MLSFRSRHHDLLNDDQQLRRLSPRSIMAVRESASASGNGIQQGSMRRSFSPTKRLDDAHNDLATPPSSNNSRKPTTTKRRIPRRAQSSSHLPTITTTICSSPVVTPTRGQKAKKLLASFKTPSLFKKKSVSRLFAGASSPSSKDPQDEETTVEFNVKDVDDLSSQHPWMDDAGADDQQDQTVLLESLRSRATKNTMGSRRRRSMSAPRRLADHSSRGSEQGARRNSSAMTDRSSKTTSSSPRTKSKPRRRCRSVDNTDRNTSSPRTKSKPPRRSRSRNRLAPKKDDDELMSCSSRPVPMRNSSSRPRRRRASSSLGGLGQSSRRSSTTTRTSSSRRRKSSSHSKEKATSSPRKLMPRSCSSGQDPATSKPFSEKTPRRKSIRRCKSTDEAFPPMEYNDDTSVTTPTSTASASTQPRKATIRRTKSSDDGSSMGMSGSRRRKGKRPSTSSTINPSCAMESPTNVQSTSVPNVPGLCGNPILNDRANVPNAEPSAILASRSVESPTTRTGSSRRLLLFSKSRSKEHRPLMPRSLSSEHHPATHDFNGKSIRRCKSTDNAFPPPMECNNTSATTPTSTKNASSKEPRRATIRRTKSSDGGSRMGSSSRRHHHRNGKRRSTTTSTILPNCTMETLNRNEFVDFHATPFESTLCPAWSLLERSSQDMLESGLAELLRRRNPVAGTSTSDLLLHVVGIGRCVSNRLVRRRRRCSPLTVLLDGRAW